MGANPEQEYCCSQAIASWFLHSEEGIVLLENTVSKGVQQINTRSQLSFQCFLHIMFGYLWYQ